MATMTSNPAPALRLARLLLLTALGCGLGACVSKPSENAEETTANSDADDDNDDDDDDSSSEDDGEEDEGGGDACEQIECDPGKQNCAEGQKCTAWRCGDGCCTNSTRCTDVTGTKEAGDVCERDKAMQIDNCGPGLFCMPDKGSTGEGGPGKCLAHCVWEKGGSGNCDEIGQAGQHCFNFNRGSFPACLPTCDPITRNCPEEEQECYLAIDNFFCTNPTAPDGTMGEPAKAGEECYTEQGCIGGTICTPSELQQDCRDFECEVDTCGCCAKVCDLRAEDPDAACDGDDEKCVAVIRGGSPEVEHVGVCVVPRD